MASGRILSPRRVPGSQEVLALAYDGSALQLLTGTSPTRFACCSSAEAIRFSGGRFGSARGLVGGLAGATVGSVLTVPGKVLAAVATERGVWDALAPSGANPGRARRVDRRADLPEALGTALGARNQLVLVWTARASQFAPGPSSIFVARSAGKGAPRGQAVAITVPSGHRIDELQVAHRNGGATVAWIESWFDTSGAYHSQTMVADLGRGPGVVSSTGGVASGLAFAGNSHGAQALAWRECAPSGSCTLRAALRAAGGSFRPAQTLGAVDASGSPAVAVSKRGTALLGWIAGGHVRASSARVSHGGFGGAQVVSGAQLSSNLALAFGPGGQALAAWTTTAEILAGAIFR